MPTDLQTRHPHFIQIDKMEASAIQGLYSKSISQYLKITKWAIQKYLEQCLHPEGQFRPFFTKFADFTTDIVVNEALDKDPDKKHVQIARYFSGMREAPPQIFVQANSYEYTPASLGGLAFGKNMRDRDRNQVVRVMDVVPIPVEITCAATKEQELEDLLAFVTMSMGQMMKFTVNYYLHPERNTEGIYWEVRIPLTHSMGGISHSPLHDDPRDQLWQATLSMTVDFENSTFINYKAHPKYLPSFGGMSVNIPDQIRLGNKTFFSITDIPYPIRVYSDDPKIALIQDLKTRFVVWPKRLGTFRIMVAKDNKVIAEKPVTIVIR